MNFTNVLRVASIGIILAVSSGAAYAKNQGTPQTHHCKQQDGTMDLKKTKKQCLAASGTWAKDASDAAAAPAPAAAATPAAPATPATPAVAPAPKS
ncbi:MAG: hypothetical protein JWR07_1462 [Nevskia sp.]|nr:hypothetical protein [Nevskia sp.]